MWVLLHILIVLFFVLWSLYFFITNIFCSILYSCYCLFSTDLNKIFHIISLHVVHKRIIKMTLFNSLHTLDSVVTWMIHSCVFLFSDSCSWVPCLSWTGKLAAVLQKNPSGPTNSLVFQHFCVFEPFPTMTVWFWDPSFHTEDNWGTHLQLLQKIQTPTDASEGKTMH